MSVPSRIAAAPGDTSPVDVGGRRICAWCRDGIPATARRDSRFCGKRCRQASWRFDKGIRRSRPPAGSTRSSTNATRRSRIPASCSARPMVFAYADPPYPGKASLYPERQEVDHASLVDRLERDFPDGWALSTSARALRDVWALCPPATRLCIWRRRTRRVKSREPVNAWEPLLIHGGRELDASVAQDLSDILDYRGRYDAFPGALVGMKPPEFAVWMFRLLGAGPGDAFYDLFPGSGAVGVAWTRFSRRVAIAPARRDASLLDQASVGTAVRCDASHLQEAA